MALCHRRLRAPSLLVAAALAASSVVSVTAKPQPMPFSSEFQADLWGLEEGFAANSCSGILLGPDGYLWLGTFRGLVRFNGREFTAWAPPSMPSLQSTRIISMFKDRRGRIWLSTLHGLVMNDGATWQRWGENEGWSDPSDYVRSYAEDDDGNLVFGRFNGGVTRFEGGRLHPLPTPPGEGGTFCAFDRHGTLYATRKRFAGVFDGGEWKNLSDDETLDERILGAGQDRNGDAIFVCRDEVLRLQRSAIVSRLALSEPVGIFWQLAQDLSGALWLSGVEAGAFRIRPDGQVKHLLKADGLPNSGGTRVVYPDEHGNIWIGSGVGGLARLRPPRFRFLSETEGIVDREVPSLAPLGDGRVLLALYGGGLLFFDGVGRVTPASIRDSNQTFFRAVLRGRDNAIWIGSFSPALSRLVGDRLEPVAGQIFSPEETVSTLFEDSRGRLWAASDRMIGVREAGVFRTVVLPDGHERQPTFFAERRDGTILLGRHNEIFTYGANGVSSQPWMRLPSEWRISTLLVDQRDRVWVGSLSHGLGVVRSGRFHPLSAERGLPGPSVSALVVDNQGRLWFGAGRKIVSADPDLLASGAADGDPPFRVFDQGDGWRELDFTYGSQPTVAKDDQGRLWFAQIRGAALVDPTALTFTKQAPKAVVETVSYVRTGEQTPVNVAVSPNVTPTLPSGSRLIRVSYAALDWSGPRSHRFRVRLDEKSDWQSMREETTVSFVQLPPGRHTLQIQAAGTDGTWEAPGVTFAFRVEPFIWQTGWFRAVIAVGLLTLASGAAWLAAGRRTKVAQEKLESERHLAEAQARLALVLENTSDFVAFTDSSENIAYINRAGRSLIGLPPAADAQPLPISAILPPWAMDQFTRVALPAALREGTWSGESALRHRDGRQIPVSQVIVAHRAADGKLDFTSMIARDISVTKRHSLVQDALRGLATSLTAGLEPRSLGFTVAEACRMLFSHDAFFLVLLDSHGHVTLGAYMEDTEVGETEPREVPPSIHSLSHQMQPVLQGTPLLVNRPDETTKGIQDRFEPWGNVARRSLSIMHAPVLWEGEVVGIVSVQSYTPGRYSRSDLQQLQTLADHCGAAIARMNAEALLRRNEGRLRLAMQTARMGSWEIDVKTRRVLASPEAEDVYGYTPGTLSGPVENLVARMTDSAARELRTLLDDLLQGRTDELNYTHSLALPDGSERWVELKGHRQQQPDSNAPARIIGVTADITTRRLAELERAKLEEQLRQSQKLEAVGTLAGGIAHDFNNILTAILGNVDLGLADAGPDHPVRASLEKIKKSGQRARDLVRRILAFSRPHETRRQPTNALPVVEEVVKLLRSTIPAGIEIHVSSAPDIPLIEVDSTELHQVLLNLGTNAWHALGSRHGYITFGLDVETVVPGHTNAPADLPAGRYVRISVNDNGRGIPPDLMPRIFDPFFTTKSPGEGTGLGLSVVHGIVRANGGAINVISTVNVGSTFELFFPASAATTPTAPVAAPRAAPSTPRPGHGERLLFVDDEEALIMVAERVFGRAGYSVVTSQRPKQALEIFRADPDSFQLVISDLSMPGMSGLDLARELLSIRPSLPVILTSGYLRPGEAEAARLVGVREVIEKPNTPTDLLPLIARLLATPVAPK